MVLAVFHPQKTENTRKTEKLANSVMARLRGCTQFFTTENGEKMNHLLKELRLNTQTSCTVDEAVGMMLGVWGVDCYLDEELNEHDYTFCLSEYLFEQRDILQNAHNEALLNNEPLQPHLEKIEEFDTNYMKRAKMYLCLVEDEIAKESESQLRGVIRRNGVIVKKRITLASLDEWWTQKKDANHSIFNEIRHNAPKNNTESELNLNANVTFGLLLNAYIHDHVANGVHKFGAPNDANISAVYTKLSNMLAQEIETSKGQSEKSIRDRISAAQKAYQAHISEHGKN